MRDASETAEYVFSLLRSESSKKRVAGLVQAGHFRMREALEPALVSLRDPDPEVRATAAWTIDCLQAPEAVPALLQALYDRVFAVRSAAGWALLHIGQGGHQGQVIEAMSDVLHSSRSLDARESARTVLGYLCDERAERILDEAPFTPVLH